MPPSMPPFATGITYFRHDAKDFKLVHRPGWSAAELRNTIKIIWTGDDALRTYYNAAARRRAPALPGLPAQRPVLPMYPFLPVDAVQAHNTRTMPVERNAAGLPIPPVAGAGPVPAPAPAPAPGHPPAAAQAPVIAPAANRQVHSYPFSFWPAQPWHMEPQNDLTLDMNVADMNVADMNVADMNAADANRNRWLNTNIYLWPTGNDGNWHGCKVLGSGSHGCAGLWCRVDENDNIIERTVVKETKVTAVNWRDPIQWRDRLPMEIHIHRKIDSIQSPAGRRYQNLIEHKGYRLMMRQRRHRIYLAYHEGRSLWDTVEYSSRRRPFPPLRRDRHGRYPDIVSEYFIWRVFQALVNACQVLHFGQISDAPGVRADWKPITHLDIKPDNVFLGTRWNDDGTIAVITSPQCPDTTSNHPSQTTNFVLADFGLSIHPMELAQNPQAAAAIGLNYGNENPDQYVIDSDDTPMYYAPEHRFASQNPPYQLKEKTDIWQIGASIWYLMANGQPGSHHGPQLVMTDGRSFEFVADKDYNIREDPDPWPPGNFPTIATYSAELRDLMRHCLEWDEPDRPGLIDLKNIIDRWLDGRANPGPGSVQFFDSPEFRIGARRPARR